MSEHAVMAIIKGFEKRYLKGQALMGFAVLDEGLGIIVASSFDEDYGRAWTNPIKRWGIYETDSGFQAHEIQSDTEFKDFVLKHRRSYSA